MIDNFEKTVNGKYDDVQIDYNLHTHNYLCGHATGTVSDYVNEAKKNGLKLIGISDHFAPNTLESTSPYINKNTLDGYLSQFDEIEHGDGIVVKKALESEYFANDDHVYESILHKLDYLVLGQHYYFYDNRLKFVFFLEPESDKEVFSYYDQLLAGIRSGYFKVLAHPDVMLSRMKAVSPAVLEYFEKVVVEAAERGMYVELNAQGIRNGFLYPTTELVEICLKNKIKVVVSSDAHSPQNLCDDNMKKLYCFAKEKGVNIVNLTDLRFSLN